jgi:integrase
VIEAPWKEIDLPAKTWTVPGKRMKGGKEHQVPLSGPAVAVLKELRKVWNGDPDGFIFPSDDPAQPLSNNAMLALLERMKHGDITVHGFRSTFDDWAHECTSYPDFVIEKALAHSIKDKAVAAYRRGALFEKRRALMTAWAGYCEKTKGSTVVPMVRKTRAINHSAL